MNIGPPWWLVLFVLLVPDSNASPATIDKSKTKSTVHITAGHRAVLECYYKGFPRPEAIWMRNGVKMKACKHCVTHIDNATPGVAKLYVTPYRDKDFGEYVCKARNKNGFDSVKISVVEQPSDETQCRKDLTLGKDPRLRLEFRPRCDPDGTYHRVQCSIHLHKCWCVDKNTGHKVADAYKAADGMHCTAPKDVSVSAIVVISLGSVLVLIVLDIVAFACCKKGLTHCILRCKYKYTIYGKLKANENAARRLSTIEEGSDDETDGINNKDDEH